MDNLEMTSNEVVETPKNPLEDKVKELEALIASLESDKASLSSKVNEYETKEFYGSLDFMGGEDLDAFKGLDLPLDTKRGMVDFLKGYRKPKDTSTTSSIVEDTKATTSSSDGYEYTTKTLDELL